MSFREEQRFDYPLTPQSVVIDIGAHLGSFSKTIADKYGCSVVAYEPVHEFCEKAKKVCEGLRVDFYEAGVAAEDGMSHIAVNGDSSTFYSLPQGRLNSAHLISITAVLFEGADLVKINAEGAELEILEAMLQRDLVKKCRFIQVQFHDQYITGWHERYLAIHAGLEKTHRETWGHGWQWENWELRHDTKPVL